VGWVDPWGLDGAAIISTLYMKGKFDAQKPISDTNQKKEEWKPANPERTDRYICEGLKNSNLINRQKEGFANDLSWRDAEHYLFAYDATLNSGVMLPFMLPSLFYASLGYSLVKETLPLDILPEGTSPGSWTEAKMGVDGSFDAMNELLGMSQEKRRWGSSCEYKKE
jgi:hypothetical protein